MASRPSPTALVVAAWLGLCGVGAWQLLAHATVAGAVGPVPARLPAELAQALRWSGQRPLVVVAAHPQCPCLPSTLDTLADALAYAKKTAGLGPDRRRCSVQVRNPGSPDGQRVG